MTMNLADLGNYFANQIYMRKLDYCAVIAKYPQYKDSTDAALVAQGHPDLIRTDCAVTK